MRAAVVVIVCACAEQPPSPTPPMPVQIPACATDLQPELAKLNVPGLAAGIVKHGALMCTTAAGMANIADNRPVTADTLFMLASTSKTVTATTLLALFDDRAFE